MVSYMHDWSFHGYDYSALHIPWYTIRKGPPSPFSLLGLTKSRINHTTTMTTIQVSFDEETLRKVLLGDKRVVIKHFSGFFISDHGARGRGLLGMSPLLTEAYSLLLYRYPAWTADRKDRTVRFRPLGKSI